MGYQEAANIRKNRLSDMIAQRLVEGEGIGSSFTKSLSERTKANITGLKQKVDYLNIGKKVFGGSNLAPALLGRLTGRSADSIRFFAGKGSAKPVGDKSTKIEGAGQLEQTDAIYETLNNIYGFLKDSNDEFEQKKVEEEGKLEEKEFERKKRHEELLKLLGYTPEKPTATKVNQPEEEKGLLSKILFWFKSPVGMWLLGLGGMAALFGSLYFGLKMLAEVTPNMKALSPQEAQNILENASENDIKAFGGRAYLEDVIKNGRQKAIDALEMPEGTEEEQKKKAKVIRELGGFKKVLNIAEDATEYEIPTKTSSADPKRSLDTPDMPERVTPKAQFKVRNKTKTASEQIWDQRFGPYYNEDGTRKTNEQEGKRIQEEAKATSASLKRELSPQTAIPVVETPTTGVVAQKTYENLDLQLPQPTVEAKQSVINNTTINSQDTSQVAIIPMPSVRNQEPTYQDMILYSTRVV